MAKTDRESFRTSIFSQFGVVSDDEGGGAGRVDAASVGAGIKYRLNDNLSLAAYCAWPLVDIPINTTVYKQHNSLGHFSFNYSF
jgi:hypothetical protein